MKKSIIFSVIASVGLTIHSSAQNTDEAIANNYALEFSKAYKACPTIPKGLLEAVSFVNTRFENLTPDADVTGCHGIPSSYGVMGLKLDGKTIFNNNASLIAAESHISIEDIVTSPEKNILAYALAYSSIKSKLGITSNALEQQLPVLTQLSDLKESADLASNFALESTLFDMMVFLNDDSYSALYHFPNYNIDLVALFGKENYNIHSAKIVFLGDDDDITNENGDIYNVYKVSSGSNNGLSTASNDYGPAIWNPAPSCNYGGSRSNSASTNIVIHTGQTSYGGIIATFKNCNSHVSAHYVIKSSSGQITQMVKENTLGQHISGNNAYTIGIEHEGFVSNSAWYTTTMYIASAKLVRDICSGHGISRSKCYNGAASAYYSPKSSIYKIKGHQHYTHPTQHTDPGKYWNWSKYYGYVNASSLKVGSDNLTNNNGSFTNGLYPNPASQNVTISFEEKNHDLPVFVEITSLDGRLMMQEELPASIKYEEVVNIESLNIGMYLVKIINGDNAEFKRLQIVR